MEAIHNTAVTPREYATRREMNSTELLSNSTVKTPPPDEEDIQLVAVADNFDDDVMLIDSLMDAKTAKKSVFESADRKVS